MGNNHLVVAQRAYVARVVGVARGCHLHKLAVQVYHVRRAGPLVQVVDVLRHNRHVEVLFECCQQLVPAVGHGGEQLFAPRVVKVGYKVGVGFPAFGGGHLLNGIFLPQAAGVAESLEPAFGAHARAGKNNNLFHGCKFDEYYKSSEMPA